MSYKRFLQNKSRLSALFSKSLQIATIAVLAFTLAAQSGRWHKLFELSTHFRVQYFASAICFILAFAILRKWKWMLIASSVAVLNLGVIAPLYVSANKPLTEKQKIKLALVNVNHANRDYTRLVDFARHEQADVLVLQEIDDRWMIRLRGLNDVYPHVVAAPRWEGSGIVLLSKFRLENAQVISLGAEDASVRPCITAQIKIKNQTLSLLSIHPRAPIRRGHFELRNAQLAAAANYLAQSDEPKILIGDLNATMWTPYFADLLKVASLRDARRGFGVLASWGTFMPFGQLLMLPIDHCLVSGKVEIIDARTGDDIGSDHLAFIVELSIN